MSESCVSLLWRPARGAISRLGLRGGSNVLAAIVLILVLIQIMLLLMRMLI